MQLSLNRAVKFYSGILVGLWLFTCCKKTETSTKISYMNYEISGKPYRFDTCFVTLMGQYPNSNPPFYYCSIASGRYGESGVVITFYDDRKVDANVYTQDIFDRSGLPATIIGGYKDEENNLYISWQNGWPLYDVSLKITEVTNTQIRGTFNGTLRKVGDTNTLQVSNGSFLALINR